MTTATTLFVSDIHLNEQQPQITERFIDFIRRIAPQAQTLYIIGDLFEAWIGDDEQTSLQKTIAQELSWLNDQNVNLYFIHGNRDFLLGQRYAQQSQLQLLSPEQVIDLYGQKWLIMHGDQLCTFDRSYQRYRRITQIRWLQYLAVKLPLRWRQHLARKLRQQSQNSTQNKDQAWLDVCSATVKAYCDCHRVHGLIHGHTHKGALHLDESPYPRIVLNDWDQQGNYVYFTQNGEFDLVYF